MEACRAFIIDDSLFADGIAHLLTDTRMAEVTGCTLTLEVALPLLKTGCPDAVTITASEPSPPVFFESLLITCPDLSIIYLNRANKVQIITSQRIEPHRSDLLASIAALPWRNR